MGDFNLRKTISLAQYFIDKCGEGGNLSLLKCLKLMYLTERQMYESYRRFITNDRFVSMRHGPVLSYTYDLIKENEVMKEHPDQKIWNNHIKRNNNDLSINSRLIIDIELEFQEKIVIEQIEKDFGEIKPRDLVDIVHSICSEWKETASSIPIEIFEIEKAVHNETAEQIYARVMSDS